jgi:hypothetical protein
VAAGLELMEQRRRCVLRTDPGSVLDEADARALARGFARWVTPSACDC